MIFRTPLEIMEPVWKDETVPSPPVPEPTGATALQPQFEAEAPVASQDAPLEPPPEPPYTAPSIAATSLDSFSLDEAATGQIHFASEMIEGTPVEMPSSAPAEEVPTAEYTGLASAPEAVSAGSAPPEAAPEIGYTEIAPPETAREATATPVAPPLAALELLETPVVPPVY